MRIEGHEKKRAFGVQCPASESERRGFSSPAQKRKTTPRHGDLCFIGKIGEEFKPSTQKTPLEGFLILHLPGSFVVLQ